MDNTKKMVVALVAISIGTLSISIKHKENPINYITNNNSSLVNKSSEKPTGKTSKANVTKPKKDYNQTVKEMNNKNIDNKNIDISELNNFISNNSTFFLQILSSNQDVNNLVKNINNDNNIKTIQINEEKLKEYNKTQKNKIVATPGTVVFYENGLITSQFDPNYSHDNNTLKQSYSNWVQNMLKNNKQK